MPTPANGYFFHDTRRPCLAELIVEDGDTRTTLWRPTEHEVVNLCLEHDFDVFFVLKIIREMDPTYHTLFIQAERFRQHIKEQKNNGNGA